MEIAFSQGAQKYECVRVSTLGLYLSTNPKKPEFRHEVATSWAVSADGDGRMARVPYGRGGRTEAVGGDYCRHDQCLARSRSSHAATASSDPNTEVGDVDQIASRLKGRWNL